MKIVAIILAGIVVVLFGFVMMAFVDTNESEASVIQSFEGERRIKLEYQTNINGINWYIFNIDGRDYVGSREGGLTLLENE